MSTTTTTYKCLSCGAGIAWNPESHKFDCDFCLSSFTQEELTAHEAQQAERETQKVEQKTERIEQSQDRTHQAEEQGHMAEYVCDSCGAQVVTDDTTAATFCYYCHNPVIVTERLSGAFKPDLVLPFHLTEDKAQESFLSWAKGHRYVPGDFGSKDHLEKMTGLYLPYWMNDMACAVDFSGTSRKTRTWTSGNYIYTETSVYQHDRQGQVTFDDLPAIAFSKFDPDLLRAVTPFELEEAQNFQSSYLSGFFAERYDMDQAKVSPVLEDAARGYTNTILYQGLQGHGSVQESHKHLTPKLGDWALVLLPTWVLTYQYKDATYVYAVNGQTGKAYGELPFDRNRLLRDAIVLALIVIAAVVLGTFWFWR